ncbi:MAG: NUDIX domain-containing protein [Balneolaceae bacterium]|nr:NUDIX domain-containing protein [Balneolaceae bacterium]MBO6546008.1 NUDIX domain-containing protein [Balneolaceae bacterium]MBO6647404.1 NUDIX domain-containing protein [Balneolaceae bacterium]
MLKPVIAAGGVLFHVKPEDNNFFVLLIYRNGFWDLPKGKLEKGESIPMCAAREVAEETGSELPVIIASLGTTYHEYKEKKNHFGKTTYWYSMIYPRSQDLKPQRSEGIEKIEWVELSKAKESVGFENLREVLYRFENHRHKKRHDL